MENQNHLTVKVMVGSSRSWNVQYRKMLLHLCVYRHRCIRRFIYRICVPRKRLRPDVCISCTKMELRKPPRQPDCHLALIPLQVRHLFICIKSQWGCRISIFAERQLYFTRKCCPSPDQPLAVLMIAKYSEQCYNISPQEGYFVSSDLFSFRHRQMPLVAWFLELIAQAPYQRSHVLLQTNWQ